MGRIYYVPFSATAINEARDLFEITAASGKPFKLKKLHLFQTTDLGDAQEETIPIIFKRGVGFTSGSGGSSATLTKRLNSDPSPGATAEVVNTTQATVGGGTLTELFREGWNIRIPYDKVNIPELDEEIAGGDGLIISIPAPTDSVTINGYAVIEEN